MGRLQALSVIVGVLVSCNESGANPQQNGASRSEAVTASASAPAPASSSASAHAPAPATPRSLCSPPTGRVMSTKIAPTRVDPVGQKSDGKIDLRAAKYTWVDFFASWCGPCKEEQPRIEGFASKLSKDGVDVQLVHVSIDDDLRELTAYLQGQTRMKTALWLPDGPPREGFLASLKMKPAPVLPEHAIVASDGSVKCFIEGALVDADYAELLATLKR